MRTLRPVKLAPGDLIGLVSPASTIADPARIERGVQYLERLGYRTMVGASVTRVHGYLAGTDEERVADLHTMFADRRVRAILCIRGGYGTPRLLPLLDYTLIRRNPKLVIGFSDITALQLALWRKCRLVTLHGPMLGVDMAGTFDPYAEELFWRCATSTAPLGAVAMHDSMAPFTVRPGKGSGTLLGGNLALIASQIGTPYMPDFTRAVLFMEDVGEEPYRVDRMLTQMRNAGILRKVAAVVAGQFSDAEPKDPAAPTLTMQEVFQDTASRTQKPFLANAPFGHISAKMTLPLGVQVRVDTRAGSIEFLHAAVRN